MGCHTWFSVPYKTDKKEIIEIAQNWLNKSDHVSIGHKKMYQWAIDNEIEEPVCELASFETDTNHKDGWLLYKDIDKYSKEKYNNLHGTNIDFHDSEAWKGINIELYSNEPRIGGYPDTIIKSYDQMVEFIKTGFTNAEGTHFDFRYEQDRKEHFMYGIETFFINHPNGIITFG